MTLVKRVDSSDVVRVSGYQSDLMKRADSLDVESVLVVST